MSSTAFRRRTLLSAFAALVAIPLAGIAQPTAQAVRYSDELKEVRSATARLHALEQARKAGYLPGSPCVASPAGVMGVHYENAALMATPEVDPLRPEILLYAPDRNGKLKLVALEYWRAAAGAVSAPVLFGQTFQGPMEGHSPVMAAHYDLHVWVWKDNPAGTFADFNPTLTC